jgi:hypothetical protein
MSTNLKIYKKSITYKAVNLCDRKPVVIKQFQFLKDCRKINGRIHWSAIILSRLIPAFGISLGVSL